MPVTPELIRRWKEGWRAAHIRDLGIADLYPAGKPNPPHRPPSIETPLTHDDVLRQWEYLRKAYPNVPEKQRVAVMMEATGYSEQGLKKVRTLAGHKKRMEGIARETAAQFARMDEWHLIAYPEVTRLRPEDFRLLK